MAGTSRPSSQEFREGSRRSPKRSSGRNPKPAHATHSRTSTDTPGNRGAPITFGIEVEAALVFHQTKLQEVLDKYYKSIPTIVKQFSLNAHRTFVSQNDLSHSCRELYPSWVLEVPNDYEKDKSLSLMQHRAHDDFGRTGRLRPYLAEPLIVAKELLHNEGLDVEVRAEVLPARFSGLDNSPIKLGNDELTQNIVLGAPNASHSQWILTTDHSLIGMLDSQLRHVLSDQSTTQSSGGGDSTDTNPAERKWDSAGIELVSPIFRFTNKKQAYTDVDKYLTALKYGPGWRLESSRWAGLHVHVGLDFNIDDDRSLLVLQHLAYILICHEDLISKLHPRNRCGLPIVQPTPESLEAEEPIGSDDGLFVGEGPPPLPTMAEIEAENEANVLKVEANLTGFQEIKSNRRFFLHNLRRDTSEPPPRLTTIRARLFDPNLSIPELVALIQKPATSDRLRRQHRHRGYMYNFSNIAAMFVGSNVKPPKPTIEFRQHGCSIKPNEIQYWIEFCFALVKFAQRMANSTNKWGTDQPLDTRGSPSRQLQGHSPGLAEHHAFAEREGQKYPSAQNGKWPCESITKFCGPDFLNLDEEAVDFWQGRYERFKDDRPAPHEIDESASMHAMEFEP